MFALFSLPFILQEKEVRADQKEREREERQKKKEQRAEERKREECEKEAKRQKRAEAKLRREQEQIKKAVGGRLDKKVYTCGICGERGRVIDEMNAIRQYGCDENACGKWHHYECLGVGERDCLRESVDEQISWYCSVCKPWLYEEE